MKEGMATNIYTLPLVVYRDGERQRIGSADATVLHSPSLAFSVLNLQLRFDDENHNRLSFSDYVLVERQTDAFVRDIEIEDQYEVVCVIPLSVSVSEATFLQELTTLINKRSLENGSNTPDYILAGYLESCLLAFNIATVARDRHEGRT